MNPYPLPVHPEYTEIIDPLSAAVSREAVDAVDIGRSIENAKLILLDRAEDLLGCETGNEAKSPINDSIPYVSLELLSERLHNGKIGPGPMPNYDSAMNNLNEPINESTSLGLTRTLKAAENRPLEDFEDLYYAILARVKTLHQDLRLRVNHGFAYLDHKTSPSGPTFMELWVELQDMWALLNDPRLVKTLDDTCRRSRAKACHTFIVTMEQRGKWTPEYAAHLMDRLYGDAYYQVPGLSWIGDWTPAMICAHLQEKYRQLLLKEMEEEKEAKLRARALEDFHGRSQVLHLYHAWLKEISQLALDGKGEKLIEFPPRYK